MKKKVCPRCGELKTIFYGKICINCHRELNCEEQGVVVSNGVFINPRGTEIKSKSGKDDNLWMGKR